MYKQEAKSRDIHLLAPVAEFLGVCILEQTGTRRAVWSGSEYGTDGLIYILKRTNKPNAVETYGLPKESVAKTWIEQMTDKERSRFCSYLDALLLLTESTDHPNYQAAAAWMEAGGHWVWDESQGTFIAVGPKNP